MLNITATLQRSATSYLGLPSVLSVNGETGVVVLDKTDIGLPNVLNVQQEPALGNPVVNGYVLSSTTGGTRSWVVQSGGGGGGVFADLDFTASNLTSIETRLFSSLQSIPTTLAGYGIIDAQALDADLTSWAAITRAAGFDTFTATPSVANLKSLLSDETTVVGNLLSLANPSAISFIQIAADNTVSTRTPAEVLSDIGAQASGSYVLQSTTVNGHALSANVTVTPTDLGLVIGTNVQAYDADLTTWAGITPGTGVGTALAINVGSTGAFIAFDGALGTPSSGTATNLTGTASGLTVGNVTTNANLTGHVTSTGNAAVLGSFTLAQLNTAVSDDNVAGLAAANTFTAANIISTAGAASTPSLKLSGVPFAGTGTTSFPLFYINDANATASTTLNTAGTYLGVNGDGTQDLMSLLKDGTSQFLVKSDGRLATNSHINIGTDVGFEIYTTLVKAQGRDVSGRDLTLDRAGLHIGSAAQIVWSSRGATGGADTFGAPDTQLTRKAAGVIQAGTTTGNALGSFTGTFIAEGTATSCTGGTIGTGSKNNAGFVTATTTGVSTIVITFSVTAPTSWSVMCSNITNATTLIQQTAKSTTTATLSGTTASGDVIQYIAMPY